MLNSMLYSMLNSMIYSMLNCGWKSEAMYHQEENKQIIHVKIRIIVTKLSRTHSLR